MHSQTPCNQPPRRYTGSRNHPTSRRQDQDCNQKEHQQASDTYVPVVVLKLCAEWMICAGLLLSRPAKKSCVSVFFTTCYTRDSTQRANAYHEFYSTWFKYPQGHMRLVPLAREGSLPGTLLQCIRNPRSRDLFSPTAFGLIMSNSHSGH